MRTLLALGHPSHPVRGQRWLLEVFTLSAPCPEVPARHAVWLESTRLPEASRPWRWWCCCGQDSGFSLDLVGALVSARMHFGDFPASSRAASVDHLMAVWHRLPGQESCDSEAVADAARLILNQPAD